MSDLERELRDVLDDRAGRVESDLTGPELRRIAAGRAAGGRGRVRRAAPVLASAAAVAALGIGAALLATPSDPPPPVEPGGPRPVTSAPATPSTQSSDPRTPSVSATPLTPVLVPGRSAPTQPSVPLGRLLPTGTAEPSRTRSLPARSRATVPPRPSVSSSGR